MLQINAKSKILLAIQPIDFRKGIDGIVSVCNQHLATNPINGVIFVFRNKSKNSIKLLCYDGSGYWLCIKRLSSGRFKWWPDNSSISTQLSYKELFTLINNGNPITANFSPDWHPIHT
jgi:transposase